MEANFKVVHPWILVHEGGYINHPRDPGGATNQGVTQGAYSAWRRAQKRATQDVRKMTAAERDAIYRAEYWDIIRGDDLPPGVDYAVYDFAVNSGPARAARYLQRVVGAKQDGIIGSQTLAAVAEHDPEMIVRRLCNDRMDFLRGLSHWGTFGRGWTRRVVGQFDGAQDDDTGVLDRALKLARAEAANAPTSAAPGKATEGAEDAPVVVVASEPAPPVVVASTVPATVPVVVQQTGTSTAGEVLVDQPTDRTSRKVEYSAGGGGLGALGGAVLGAWTFTLLPLSFQEVDMAMELWTGVWAGAIAYLSAFQLGRRVRERLENMLPIEGETP